VFIFEDAPEFARELPKEEWVAERNPGRIAQMLNDSAPWARNCRLDLYPDFRPGLRYAAPSELVQWCRSAFLFV